MKLPEAFEKRMKEMLQEEYEEFVEGFEREQYQGLRCKKETKELVSLELCLKREIPWCDRGFYYDETIRPGKHYLHEIGAYYIQEPSAMSPVEYLQLEGAERVLDLCAAPGGKTTQIADLMQNKGLLVSNEIHPKRSRILAENLERMGVGNVVVTNETPDRLAEQFLEYFDKILVDAPCSGEGMFRKEDMAVKEWSLENVIMCGNRQDEILDSVYKMLAPGGRMVYSTCTFAPIENEGTMARFLHKYPDMHIVSVPVKEGMERGKSEWLSQEECSRLSSEQELQIGNTVRLWPHKVSGEGHFLAVLEKEGNLCQKENMSNLKSSRKRKIKNKDKKSSEQFWAQQKGEQLWKQFIEEHFDIEETNPLYQWFYGQVKIFSDQLYLLPKEAPGFEGLHLVRGGLMVGTIKKDRIEPSFLLAKVVKPQWCKKVIELNEAETKKVLSGQELQITQKKQGWNVLSCHNCCFAWGKVVGERLKNHYPKGRRIIF